MAVPSTSLIGKLFDEPIPKSHQSPIKESLKPCRCLPDDISMAHHTTYSCSSACLVGRRLALIGDVINDEYSSEFSRFIRHVGFFSHNGPVSLARRFLRPSNVNGSLSRNGLVTAIILGCRLVFGVAGEREPIACLVQFLCQYVLKHKVTNRSSNPDKRSVSISVSKD